MSSWIVLAITAFFCVVKLSNTLNNGIVGLVATTKHSIMLAKNKLKIGLHVSRSNCMGLHIFGEKVTK